MLSLSDNKQAGVIEALNSTSSYLDVLLNIDNPYFEDILCTISLAILYVSHLYVLIFVHYRTISIAMTRAGS